MRFICQSCGEKDWSGIFNKPYKCPSCNKIYHNNCLEKPGGGFIRRGFCPNCGCEIHDKHEHTKD